MAPQQPTATASTQKQNDSPAYGTGVWISYKADTRTRLRSSFYSIARFLRIMSRSSNEPLEEFNSVKEGIGFDHVEGFCTSLSNLYKSAATYNIDRNRWRVTRISTFKSTHGVEHESLVAEVVCGQVIVYLRIERKLHASRVGKLFGKSKESPKIQTSDDSDPSPDNAAYPRNETRPTPIRSTSKIASDEITYSKTFTNVVSYKREEWVDVIEFPEGEGLSLPQIAVLARCVNSLGRTYNLFKENCYWFAYVMVEAAKLIRNDYKLSTISKRKRGSWNGLLSTTKPTEVLVEQARSRYDDQWEAFNKDIYTTINNPNSEIYQQERRGRETAERLEKEERSKREEEQRKREEAERLEKEERRKREEEQRKREEAERLEKEERRKREEAEEEIKRLKAQLAAAQAVSGTNSSS